MNTPSLLPNRKEKEVFETNLDLLARYYLRERLRIGAQEIWEETGIEETQAALTLLTDHMLEALLALCRALQVSSSPEPEFASQVLERVAILGLGKLGGAELGYASDWDVLFVYDEMPALQRKQTEEALERTSDSEGDGYVIPAETGLVNGLIERLIAAVNALPIRGVSVAMDLRLRPWGRKGTLANSLHGLGHYYRTAAETWERQAALKARFVAGSRHIGLRGVHLLQAVSYGHGLSEEEDTAIRAMKLRIEKERLKPEERHTDLKLGYGGLTDIEWLAQRLQFRFGMQEKSLRVPNTARALSALAAARHLDNAEADSLTASYTLLSRLRNLLWLQTGKAQDTLPADPVRRRALALQIGYGDTESIPAETALWTEIESHRLEIRRIFERRFHDVS